MSTPAALPALPGASDEPGSGPLEPAVLDGLLDDAAPLGAHRRLLAGDHRDLAAALVVPAPDAEALREAVTAADLGLRVLLVAGGNDPLEELRAARAGLLDLDTVDLVGARLPLPALPGAAGDAATAVLLGELDSSLPSWITVPVGATATPVLDVLAADGAENVTLDVTAGDAAQLAEVLRGLVDRDLTFRVAGLPGVQGGVRGGVPGGGPVGPDLPGLLNVLCATRAALNGAEPGELAAVLAARRTGPLVSALRRMSAADGAVTRAFLVAAEVPDAGAAASELDDLGLLPHPHL